MQYKRIARTPTLRSLSCRVSFCFFIRRVGGDVSFNHTWTWICDKGFMDNKVQRLQSGKFISLSCEHHPVLSASGLELVLHGQWGSWAFYLFTLKSLTFSCSTVVAPAPGITSRIQPAGRTRHMLFKDISEMFHWTLPLVAKWLHLATRKCGFYSMWSCAHFQ